MSDNPSTPDLLGPLMDEFVERFRRGEKPSLTEFVRRQPELEADIRELFPALVMMEHADADLGRPGDAPPHRMTADGSELTQLGDYRIVREIGRGGMGVVYEAVQESLGRHVALKVLPWNALVNPSHLKRFQREACVAASLHHTNIVPVFGVGQHQGIHFFAMQFIRGQSLDKVLSELRRLRHHEGGAAANAPLDPFRQSSIAESLLTGISAVEFQSSAGIENPLPANRVVSASGRDPNTHHPAADAPQLADIEPTENSVPAHAASETFAADKTPASLAGISESSGSSSSQHYFRRIAEIGAEVAEALEYAHGHGVLHRDVKPSNLMIDIEGTVWVTDFGLARGAIPSSDHGSSERADEDISRTGDLIGTLRYMAPERFRGQTDERSDIYSLGLTLYELLTLKPAFDAVDRVDLIRKVTHESPQAPRRVDPRVPRDLETIVLKALAHSPADRYATAQKLAEDLRRYLADRPIVARRTPVLERLTLWCRRNSVVAGLLAVVATLLVVLAVGSTIAAFRLRERSTTALKNLSRATQAEAKERDARELATRRLFDAYVAQARAGRASGRTGRRFESLEAIQNAAALIPTLKLDESARRTLRDEAIGCLALVDLIEESKWPDDSLSGNAPRHTAFDRQGERNARLNELGQVVVRRVQDQSEVCCFPVTWDEQFASPYFLFSPDGRWLAARGRTADGQYRVLLWKLDDAAPVLDLSLPTWSATISLAFAFDSQTLALRESPTTIALYATDDGRLVQRVPLAMQEALAFSPDGSRLVVSTEVGNNEVSVVNWKTGQIERRFAHPGLVFDIQWSPDGRLIAVACADKNVYVWDVQQDAQPWTVCRGHSSQAIRVAFNSNGRLLMSTSYDGTTRLWNPRSGFELVSIEHRGTGISADDRWLTYNDPALGYGRCHLSVGPECLTLVTSPPADSVVAIDFSPDGRLLAAASRRSGIDLWQAHDGTGIVRLERGSGVNSLDFTPDGTELITSSGTSLTSISRWPVAALVSGRTSEILKQRIDITSVERFPCVTAINRDGDRLAVSLAGDRIEIHDLRHGGTPVRLQPPTSIVWFVDISPNGKWVAASEKRNGDIPVWDATTGELLINLHTTDKPASLVRFSPDNRWLVVSEFGRFVFYETETWREVRRLPMRGSPCFGRIAFAPDLRSFAVSDSHSVTLYDTPTFHELATFTGVRAEQFGASYPEGAGDLAFHPQGTRLAAGTMQGTVQVWNLRQIREQLAPLALDWNLPALPKAEQLELDSAWPTSRPVVDLTPEPTASDRLKWELHTLDEKISANPNDITIQERKAQLLDNAGQIEAAIAAYSRLIELKPEQVAWRYHRALLLTRARKHAEAIADYEALLKLEPASAIAANGLAWLYATAPGSARAPEKALPLAKKAVELWPNDSNTLNTLGVVYYRLGDTAKAIETLQAAAKANPQGPTAFDHFFLAMSLQKQADTTQARDHFDKAIEWWRRQKELPPDWHEELRHFSFEAAALLGQPPPTTIVP